MAADRVTWLRVTALGAYGIPGDTRPRMTCVLVAVIRPASGRRGIEETFRKRLACAIRCTVGDRRTLYFAQTLRFKITF